MVTNSYFVCKHCGLEYESKWRFCPECGYDRPEPRRLLIYEEIQDFNTPCNRCGKRSYAFKVIDLLEKADKIQEDPSKWPNEDINALFTLSKRLSVEYETKKTISLAASNKKPNFLLISVLLFGISIILIIYLFITLSFLPNMWAFISCILIVISLSISVMKAIGYLQQSNKNRDEENFYTDIDQFLSRRSNQSQKAFYKNRRNVFYCYHCDVVFLPHRDDYSVVEHMVFYLINPDISQ